MDIPFYAILIVYVIGVLIFFMLSIFDVYHLIRYEAFTPKSKAYLIIYTVVFFGLVLGPLFAVSDIDWMDTFTLFSNGTTQF